MRFYRCDQCPYEQVDPMAYEMTQVTDELDDDDDPVIAILHFCSTQCLTDYAMGLALDFPEDAAAT